MPRYPCCGIRALSGHVNYHAANYQENVLAVTSQSRRVSLSDGGVSSVRTDNIITKPYRGIDRYAARKFSDRSRSAGQAALTIIFSRARGRYISKVGFGGFELARKRTGTRETEDGRSEDPIGEAPHNR